MHHHIQSYTDFSPLDAEISQLFHPKTPFSPLSQFSLPETILLLKANQGAAFKIISNLL